MKLLYWVWSAIIQTVILSSAVSAKSHHAYHAPAHAPAHVPNYAFDNRGMSVTPFTQKIKAHMNGSIKKTILTANDRVIKATKEFFMAKQAIRDARKQALHAERSAVKAINEKVKVTKQQMIKATRNMVFLKKELAKVKKQAQKIKTMVHAEAIRKKEKLKRVKAIEAQKRYIAIQTAVAKHLVRINKAHTKERVAAVKKAIAETQKATAEKIKRITAYANYKQNVLRKKFKLIKKRIEDKTRKEIRAFKLQSRRELKKTRDACHAMMKRHGLLIKKQYQKIKKQIALIKSLRIKQHDLIKQKQDECLASLNDLNENETINDDEEQQIIKALELANKRAGCNTSKVCKTIDVNVCHCLDYGVNGITNCLAAISKLELENTIAVKLAKEIKSLDVLSTTTKKAHKALANKFAQKDTPIKALVNRGAVSPVRVTIKPPVANTLVNRGSVLPARVTPKPVVAKAPVAKAPVAKAPVAKAPVAPVARVTPKPVVAKAPVRVTPKPVVTKAPLRVTPKPVVAKAPLRVTPKPVVAKAPVRVTPKPIVAKAPLRVTPKPVVTKAPLRVTPKPIVAKAPVRVTPKPVVAKAPLRVTPKPIVAKAPLRVTPKPVVAKAPVRVTPNPIVPKALVRVTPKPPVAKAPVRVTPKPIVAKAPVKMPFTFKTATASGDPHVDTFDGVHHDTMVAGWFSWVKNPVIHVQAYTQLGCMPANIPNTCIRAVVVQITPPHTNERLVVSWGSWPPERSVQNIVIQDSTGPSVNVAPNTYKAKTFLNGKYQIAKNGGTLSIRPVGAAVSNPELAVSVSIAEYMLAVTLPNAPPHSGQTNGLMGFFNGDGTKNYAKVFRNRDGKASAITTKSLCQGGVGACGWGSQQKPEIINWAVTHVVTASNGVNPPISFTNKPNLVQQGYLDGWKVAKPGRKLLGFSDFSPVPIAMEPIVLPSYVPKVSKEEITFCKKLLRGKVSKKKYMSQMKSCLQDASSPTVARSIAKVNIVARKQQRRAKRALKNAVRKNKQHSIERLRILYKSIQNLMKLYEQ